MGRIKVDQHLCSNGHPMAYTARYFCQIRFAYIWVSVDGSASRLNILLNYFFLRTVSFARIEIWWLMLHAAWKKMNVAWVSTLNQMAHSAWRCWRHCFVITATLLVSCPSVTWACLEFGGRCTQFIIGWRLGIWQLYKICFFLFSWESSSLSCVSLKLSLVIVCVVT